MKGLVYIIYIRPHVADSYKGVRVQWEVEFSSIFSLLGIRHYVCANTSDGGHATSFPVCLRRYPQLKVMERGARFTVQGTIASVGYLRTIDLKNCKLVFHLTTDKPNQESLKQVPIGQNDNSLAITPVITRPTVVPSTAVSSNRATNPGEIEQTLRGLPPFQVEQAAKNFVGLEVVWSVELQSTFTGGGNLYLITYLPNTNSPSIVFQIDIERYPEVRIMKKGAQFTIEGKIANVSIGKINLNDCSLHFKN